MFIYTPLPPLTSLALKKIRLFENQEVGGRGAHNTAVPETTLYTADFFNVKIKPLQ